MVQLLPGPSHLADRDGGGLDGPHLDGQGALAHMKGVRAEVPMHPTRRDEKKREILRFLNREKIRATYEAVGGLIGLPAQSVGANLGERRRDASWIVSKRSRKPTGYKPAEMHPALIRHSYIIQTSDELRRRMKSAIRQ